MAQREAKRDPGMVAEREVEGALAYCPSFKPHRQAEAGPAIRLRLRLRLPPATHHSLLQPVRKAPPAALPVGSELALPGPPPARGCLPLLHDCSTNSQAPQVQAQPRAPPAPASPAPLVPGGHHPFALLLRGLPWACWPAALLAPEPGAPAHQPGRPQCCALLAGPPSRDPGMMLCSVMLCPPSFTAVPSPASPQWGPCTLSLVSMPALVAHLPLRLGALLGSYLGIIPAGHHTCRGFIPAGDHTCWVYTWGSYLMVY